MRVLSNDFGKYDDDELLRRFHEACARDDLPAKRAIFNEIYQCYDGRVDKQVNAKIWEKHAVRDIVQEVWFTVWGKMPRPDPDRPFEKWLGTVTRGKIVDWIRKNGAGASPLESPNDPVDSGPVPGSAMADEERRAQLLALSFEIPSPDQREVFQDFYFEGLSFAEIQRRRKIDNPTTVRTRLFKAEVQFREILIENAIPDLEHEEHRTVLRMKSVEGLSLAEIATSLKRPLERVLDLLQKGSDELKKVMRDKWDW